MFYAEYCPYGITTMSYRDRVYAFDTKAVAITLKEARRSYRMGEPERSTTMEQDGKTAPMYLRKPFD